MSAFVDALITNLNSTETGGYVSYAALFETSADAEGAYDFLVRRAHRRRLGNAAFDGATRGSADESATFTGAAYDIFERNEVHLWRVGNLVLAAVGVGDFRFGPSPLDRRIDGRSRPVTCGRAGARGAGPFAPPPRHPTSRPWEPTVMNRSRDIDRILDRWMDDGPSVVVDRVIAGAMTDVQTTRQRGNRWAPREGALHDLEARGDGGRHCGRDRRRNRRVPVPLRREVKAPGTSPSHRGS